jgi:hypothetical protein
MVKTKEELMEEKLGREEAKRDLKMWMAADWDLKEETPQYFIIKKNTQTIGGHFLVFLFFGWWTLGIANLVYYFISNKTKKVMK